MAIKGLKRSIFQRIFGVAATKLASDSSAWAYRGGSLRVTLAKLPELERKGGAVRIEGKQLPARVLVYRDDEGTIRAVSNRCGHKGRRVDPVPGEKCLQCCSVNAAAYDYAGNKLEGPGTERLKPFEVEEKDGELLIALS
jgi:nitrite reductase/ring-hydroxylating ferredoxin subunit